MSPPEEEPVKKANVDDMNRRRLVVVAWMVTALCMVVRGPVIFLYVLYFPIGIIRFFHHIYIASDPKCIVMAVIGWIFYVALTVAVVATRRRRLSIFFYVILCLVLAVNVVSCHSMVSDVVAYF
jgi:hypothetical protein